MNEWSREYAYFRVYCINLYTRKNNIPARESNQRLQVFFDKIDRYWTAYDHILDRTDELLEYIEQTIKKNNND